MRKEWALMPPQRTLFVLLSFGTAAAALAAAYYMFSSSQPTPVESTEIDASISDNEALYILDARVSVDSLRSVLAESSRLNKKAAIWSGVAAIFGALAALVGLL
jgi:hypothetical protein